MKGEHLMKIALIYIIFAALFISCIAKVDSQDMDSKNITKLDSRDLNLNDVMDYNWDTPIEEIQKDFIDKQYSEIKIEDDFISAKYDYNGLFSDFYFKFFNGKMYFGGISYLGFPGERDVSEDGYTIEDINNIQKNILELLSEKYGDPQEVNEDKKKFVGEIRYYKWNFRNNCKLEFSLRLEYFILTSCWIDVRFTNNAIQEEKTEE
jgi:hypothetical protein